MKRPGNRVPEILSKSRLGPSTEILDEKEAVSMERVTGLRKKGMAARPWLRIDLEGNSEMIEADKYAIMRRVSIPARDLRILDPLLSYPSTVLGREKAIVVNLEHIKCIITADEVLLLNWKVLEVSALVEDLKHRLPSHFNALGEQVAGDGGGGLSATELEAAISEAETRSKSLTNKNAPHQAPGLGGVKRLARVALGLLPKTPPEDEKRELMGSSSAGEGGEEGKKGGGGGGGGPNALPFEFRALEACLESACGVLEKEATRLELEAYPALDELTAIISTLNLERVRQIKSRLVVISGRVQKVRDELEHLLDDDDDMNEMYLTDKKNAEAAAALSRSSSGGRLSLNPSVGPASSAHTPLGDGRRAFGFDTGGLRSEVQRRSIDEEREGAMEEGAVEEEEEEEEEGEGEEGLSEIQASRRPNIPPISIPPRHPAFHSRGQSLVGGSSLPDVDSPLNVFGTPGFRSSVLARSGHTSSSSSHESEKSLDVEELEMLLEAYFVQIEGILNKLSSLREYVDDTEDYINIMLDDKQNSLLQMNVFLTTATLFISMFVVVTAVFGMNIPLWLFDHDNPNNYNAFYYIVFGCTVGVVVLFTVVIMYIRSKGLIA